MGGKGVSSSPCRTGDPLTPAPLLSKDGSTHVTDEVCNTLISGLGAVLSVIGLAFLISRSWSEGRPGLLLGFSVYGFGLLSMFLASTLHHGINGSPKTNHLLRQIDYFAIFVMIAGSFAQFCLILLRNPLGWTVLGLVWAFAILGITVKAAFPHAPRWLVTALYIGMGWMGLLIAKPVYQAIHWQGALVFFLGGLLFTGGAFIYALERPNPFPGKFGFHEIWHCFVLAGAASHFYVMSRLL